MTRQEAIDRLCTVYQSQFDINRCEEDGQPLAVTMDFYATSEKFVLSKRQSSGRPRALSMCTCSTYPI